MSITDSYRCPVCGFNKDTPNHHFGCTEGPFQQELKAQTLRREETRDMTIPTTGANKVPNAPARPAQRSAEEVARSIDERRSGKSEPTQAEYAGRTEKEVSLDILKLAGKDTLSIVLIGLTKTFIAYRIGRKVAPGIFTSFGRTYALGWLGRSLTMPTKLAPSSRAKNIALTEELKAAKQAGV